MEIEFKDDKILFNRELSILDSFVLDFTENLVTNNIKYVIISGYVAILFGRSRMSEDVDILIEHIPFEKFLKFWSKMEKNYECLNTSNSLEAYKDYMENHQSEKDIEDARFLFKLFKDDLNIGLIKMFLIKLKIPDNNVERYLGGLDES